MVPAGSSERGSGSVASIAELFEELAQSKSLHQSGIPSFEGSADKMGQATGEDAPTDPGLRPRVPPEERGRVFEAACKYIKNGYAVVPLHGVEANAFEEGEVGWRPGSDLNRRSLA